ncbi:MAG TPA: DUF11 domain-containing protein, partial [Solirubrobacterales bacterium]|nr:DUF11 domain-containing protein [Solirubrobacterales bacterium]
LEAAEAGDQITYTLEVENEGPSGADSTTLKDVLPAGLAYVSGDASCDTSALPTIDCDLGTLASGESRQVEIVAQVEASAAGTVLSNTAETSALQPDGEPANDAATVKTPVAPFADLAIVKTVSPEVASAPGVQVTYTLEVENMSQGESDPTVVTDTLPEGLTYVSNDSECDVSALPKVECDLGALAGGATKTVHVVAEVEPSAAGKAIENTATVGGSLFDPEPANDESSATLEVEPLSDLAIAKTTATTAAKPGEQLTYLLKAENNGPTDEPSARVVDTLPAELVYVSGDASCDVSALPKVECDLGALAKGESRTISLVAEVAAAGGTIENAATVSGTNADPKPGNNASTATTPVEPVADLAIEKSASVPSIKPGETLTYVLEVENEGPSASEGTTVTDTLPPSLAYVSDDAGCDTSALPTIECDLGTMANGASATIEILTAVETGASGTIENAARVSGSDFDPDPSDDEATATTAVTPLAADLALEKSASSDGAVGVGETIAYTLAASNNGPDFSLETVVTDTLPAGLVYVSDDAGCDTSALPKVECELGTLANGATESLSIVTRVASTGSQPIRNSATVRGAGFDPVSANNPDAAEVPIEPPPSAGSPPPQGPPAAAPERPRKRKAKKPRLVVRKVASSGFARPGSVVGYRIVVRNKGNGPARNVRVCDHPPAQQETLRTEPLARGEASPCWHLERLRAGQKRVFRLTSRVEEAAGKAVQRNRATVSAGNVKGREAASAGVRVKPLPESACGLRLVGHGAFPGVRPRC